MNKILFVGLVLVLFCGFPSFSMSADEEIIADFESDEDGWEIPDWAYEKDDHVASEICASNDVSSKGKGSLKIEADFPGKMWAAAIVEVAEYYDLSDYENIAVDIYVPKDAPEGLKGKIILTQGEEWKWVEQSRSFNLTPGEWTTVTANIAPGSKDWKRTTVDEEFSADIRKIDVRVESNMKPVYKGPIYIDNIRAYK
ncbi:MAG: hypothetical protein JW728_01125 [Candidatus Aureabacteria bacterium]|nr:hypothetical protein [Candidatus Auribacterota bacterium]